MYQSPSVREVAAALAKLDIKSDSKSDAKSGIDYKTQLYKRLQTDNLQNDLLPILNSARELIALSAEHV